MTRARSIDVRIPHDPEALVVVLHGGSARPGRVAVSPTQPSVLRMVPVARGLARAGRGRLGVVRLLNSARGWDVHQTPVDDAYGAVDQLVARLPGLPVALVGHSLGGRAALLAGDHPAVRTVVALNPWVYATDDADLGGRRVLVVHGTQDRIADPARSRVVAERLGRRAEVSCREVVGGKHAMLAHHREFQRLASDFVVETLL